MEGTDSVDLSGEKSSPTLFYLLLYTLVFALRNLYLCFSIGQLVLFWHGVTIAYVIVLLIIEIPIQLAAVVTTIPAGITMSMIRNYHEKYFD